MKSFVRNDQTVGTHRAASLRGRVRLGWFAWSAAACLALMVGTAAAQQNPAPKKTKINPGAAAQRKVAPKNVETKPDVTVKPKSKAKGMAGKSGCGSSGAGADLTPVTGGPQPLWACGEPVCTIDPIWSGERIECVFMIRNEGQADLNIKAKGG